MPVWYCLWYGMPRIRTHVKITQAKIKASTGNIITANTVDISTGTEGSGTQTPQYTHTVTTGLKDGFEIGVTDDTSFDWLLPQQTFPEA